MLKAKFKILSNIIILLLSLTIVFHFLVIFGVVPADYVWSGRLESGSNMMMLETAAIVADFIILFLVAMNAGYIKSIFSRSTMNVFFWICTISFAVNTLGHIFSANRLEAVAFTPVTLILAVCFLLLTLGNKPESIEDD
jgi:hypothetical protein